MFRRAAAFNLIELLTVIAIIAILAAILVPVAGKIREQARLSNCTSNIRQWGHACLLYANDHSGLIPWDGGQDTSPGNMTEHAGTLPWFNSLPPYLSSPTIRELAAQENLPRLGDNSIFICPSAERTNEAADWLCYGPNFLLSIRSSTVMRPAITRLNMLREPNRVPLFAATTNHAPGSTSFEALNANPNHLAGATRHQDRTPVAFFDAHVETFTPEELILQHRGSNNPDFPHRVRWNPLQQ